MNIDPRSRDWRIVEEWALKGMHDTRRALENPACDERQTALLRGKVQVYHALIKLGQPPALPTEEDTYD